MELATYNHVFGVREIVVMKTLRPLIIHLYLSPNDNTVFMYHIILLTKCKQIIRTLQVIT
jgi:hypothetical protein